MIGFVFIFIKVESCSHTSSLHLTVMDEKAECDLMSIRCHVCRPTRPCCRQPLIQLWERDYHEKFVHPVKGPLRDAWGLGSVWVTCCAAYYGMYYDVETTAYQPVFLGRSEEEAIGRVNHVKSFLPTSCQKNVRALGH